MNKLKNGYIVNKKWPKDTIFKAEETVTFTEEYVEYTEPAFFEVFIKENSILIRLEGNNIKEAEAAVFNKYQKIIDCGTHEFKRMNDSNHGHCIKCGLFQSDILDSIHNCQECNKKLVYLESHNLKKHLCTKHFIVANENNSYFNSNNVIEKINNKNFKSMKIDRSKYLKIKTLLDNNNINFENEQNFNKIKGFKSEFALYLHNFLIKAINENPNKNLKFNILSITYLKDSLVFNEQLYKRIFTDYLNNSNTDLSYLFNYINEFSIDYDNFFINKYGNDFTRKIIQN